MKKSLITIAFLAGSSFVGVANAFDGTIDFRGDIRTDACTVQVGNANAPVLLGSISAGAFPNAGDTASRAPFQIVLSACTAAATSAVIKFDGSSDLIDKTLLALAPGGASGLGIGFYEEDGNTKIPLGSASLSKPLSTTAPTEFNFVAKYVSTGPVGQGGANAAANFTVNYN